MPRFTTEKKTLKWFRWLFSNDPLPHVPLRLKIPSCETRVRCRREVLLCSWTPDTPTTRTWNCELRFPCQTNVVKSPQRPRCFAGAQKLSGSHWGVRCEFWEDVGSRRSQRPFWRRQHALTCQSCHSSVNSCLILCWKLVLPGSRGQRWRVSQPPAPATAIAFAER